ncbi:MAG: InlB B-repeat-containing protein, partial [Bacteroidota bacterium]
PGESPSLPTDRPRVVVGDKNGYGYTVLTSDSKLLRGGAIWLWRAKFLNDPSNIEYAFQEEYYQTLADSGVNFIRLCIYTGSNDWGGGTNYRDTDEVNFLLNYTDSVVDFASKYGMYVLINYHDVGKYMGEYLDPEATTMGYIKEFWDIFAPRYKNRTHVFYEPANEPAFGSSNFKGALLDSMYYMYDYIKEMAPETHQSLLCITGAVSKSWDNESMVDAVDRFTAKYQDSVDWTNASIAFHPYTTTEKVYSSDPIKDVMKDYAVINTEANFPCDETIKSQVLGADKQCQTVDGELFITETMEKLGVSWNFHKVTGWDRFNQNFSLVLKDAREKGYILFGEEQQTYYFSLHAENGSIIPDIDSISKIPGSTMQFEAIASEGYEFLNWSGDTTSSSQQITIILNEQNIDLTANFVAIDSFNITVSSQNGTVELSPSGGKYLEGTEVTLTAVPDEGYEFDGWDGNSTSSDSSITITMDGDKSLTANFSTVNSIHHYTIQEKIELFPNPIKSGQALNIVLEGFENEIEATISIMDISGRIAYSTIVQTGHALSQQYRMDINNLSGGMYMVVVRGNNKVINQRLIVR